MSGIKLDMVKRTLETICDLATAGSKLSIIGFSDFAEIYASRVPVKKCYNLISRLEVYGNTNLQEGIDCGIEQLDSIPEGRRKAFFAFTDGRVNRGVTDREELLPLLLTPMLNIQPNL